MLTPCIAMALVSNTAFVAYMLLRQYRTTRLPQPVESKKIMDEKEYSDSISYGRSKYSFQIVMCALDFLKDILVLIYIPKVYESMLRVCPKPNETLLVVWSLFSILSSIPCNLYYDFVIEHRHGFNKKTIGTFFKDVLINIFLTSTIVYFLSSVSFWFISYFRVFYFYVWAFICLTSLILCIIYPSYIAPLFNTFEPLPEGSLREGIGKLAKRLNFRIEDITVMDGSKRSGHSNAYFVGLGPAKRIVFYDTILKTLEGFDSEVLAVLCHEFGHWALWHFYAGLLLSFTQWFVCIYFFNMVIGSSDKGDIALQLVKFLYLFSIFSVPLTLFRNIISRAMERQADRFAVNLGYGPSLKEALTKMAKASKSSQIVDPLFSTFNYSHPPTLERLSYIDELISKNE